MSNETPPGSSDLRTAVEASRKRRRGTIAIVVGVAAVALVVGAVAIAVNLISSPATEAAADERLHLRIATSEDNGYTDTVTEVAAEKGLDIEWTNVNDWVLPNTELAAGNVDGNSFQHILYLSNFNAENDEDLTPQFSTLILQWGIFSPRLGSLDEIEDGGRIAIPDDPSNSGRALFLAEAAGLIEIADDAGDFPTVDDITENSRNLSFVPIAAVTIPQQFDDPSLSAVIIGTSYFDPSQNITTDDALFLDDPLAESNLPYVNVIASRSDNVDDPAWAVLEEAYADPRVADAVEEEWFGATVLVQVPVETLRTTLGELEVAARAANE